MLTVAVLNLCQGFGHGENVLLEPGQWPGRKQRKHCRHWQQMTCRSEAARNRRWLLGQGCLPWLEVGTGSKLLCVSMWPCLCAMNVRGEGGRSLPGHSNQASWSTVREVRCSGFLESSHQRLQFGKELSVFVLPPNYVPEGAPFPCHLTAACGYRQHERMPCRDTQTASLWLFLGTRSSITALAQPEVWAKLACLLMRLIQLGGEQYLEAVLLTYPDCLCPALHPAVGNAYQRWQHIRGQHWDWRISR